jgi:hypothetical protein
MPVLGKRARGEDIVKIRECLNTLSTKREKLACIIPSRKVVNIILPVLAEWKPSCNIYAFYMKHCASLSRLVIPEDPVIPIQNGFFADEELNELAVSWNKAIDEMSTFFNWKLNKEEVFLCA